MISLDDMQSENIFFSWSKSSNYRGKLRCHACDGGRTDGKWKIGQCSVGPETAKTWTDGWTDGRTDGPKSGL